jgi:HD-GYP domain-containing protein (c-di-GMP phosphodiesterase class II)
LWENLEKADLRHEVSRLEPADRIVVATPERLDLVSRAFAQIIDAKSPFTYRHSESVAEVAIGGRLGLTPTRGGTYCALDFYTT